jgi:SPP1 family predicted phage head-tail adaptor
VTALLGPRGGYTVQAGKFRHRVTIQQKTVGRDSAGGITESWSNFAKDVNAAIDTVTGRESVASRQITAKYSTEISIRWRPGVTATMRVLHGSVVYNIEGMIPDSDTGRKIITLLCTQRDADGFRDG